MPKPVLYSTQWRVSNVAKYSPEKLAELVSLNLKTPDRELAKKGSPDFPKKEENTSLKGKAREPELASAKERLNKYINKNYMEAREIWERVLAELRKQVNATNYRTWLERTAGLGYHGNDFIVGATGSQVVEYLGASMRSLVEKTLIEVTQKDFKIAFRVMTKDEI